jgi:hypothetical protein
MFRRQLASCLLALGLAACGGMPDHPIRTATSDQYIAMTEEQRTAEDERVRAQYAALTRQQENHYAAGIPVRVGDSRHGMTMQWLRSRGLVQISTDGNPNGWNLATTAGTFLTIADERGNPVFNRLPNGQLAPIPLLANVANQEGMERVVFRGITNVMAGLANGAGAAGIAAAFPCVGCRGAGNINSVEVVAGASSLALGDTRVNVGSSPATSIRGH